MMTRAQSVSLVGLCLLGLGPRPAIAGIHTWDVSELFSNADGTIQFVELVEAGGGDFETGVSGGTIHSNLHDFTWSSSPVTNTANKKYLVATPAFAALTGAPTPDAIISPASNIPFFSPDGFVTFVVYDTCTFGSGSLPPVPPVPTNGVGSLNCVTDTIALNNSPTNYAGATGSVKAAIAQGSLDNFQNGTVQNWAGNPVPTNTDGGPLGAGDRYAQLTPTIGFIGTFNKSQWAGNYIAASIEAIDVDLNNTGTDPLSVRIMLLTPGCDLGAAGCTAWTSTNAVLLATGSGWVGATFSIAEADLTRVLGSDSYTASLQNVERLLIRHDDGTPSPPGAGSIVSGTAGLGIDNVLPEPSGLLGLAAGALLLVALRRGRQAARV
jgi:hypothetical protein